MPRKITVTFADGTSHVYQNVPDNVTPEQIEQRAARDFPRSRVAKLDGGRGAPAQQPGRVASYVKGALSGATDVIALPAEMLIRGMSALGVPGAREGEARNKADIAYTQAQLQKYRQAHPNYFTAGEITGQTVATAPVSFGTGALLERGGAALTRVAPRATKVGNVIAQTGKAVKTSGVGVKAPSRTARVALRATGGGIAGAEAAALTDQDILSGAEFGAGIPLLGAIGGKGLGWAYDKLKGRVGETRAARILRNLVRDKADEVRAALAKAPADAKENTAQFLAREGVMTPELAAVTQDVASSTAGAPLTATARARGEAIKQGRQALRRGTTQTEGMANIAAAKQNVRDITAPMREEALSAADVGRTQIVPAERQASAIRSGVQNELDRATQFVNDPNWSPSVESRLAEARKAEDVAANLRAQGLQPLDVDSIVGRLRQEASDAEFVNSPRERLLTTFADNLERRAKKFGGVIDATGLYELRKNMGNVVSDILGSTDPKATQAYTAQIVGEVQPLIDDAIEQAGGTGWREYLNTFSQGMRNIERQQFERGLSALPEEEFTAVMRGDRPEYVAQHFGPGRFDVNIEMADGQLAGARDLAQTMRAGQEYKNLGLGDLSPVDLPAAVKQVRATARQAVAPGVPNSLVRAGAYLLGRKLTAGGGVPAERVEQLLANRMYESALRELAPALAQPSVAARMLNTYPTANVITNWLAANPATASAVPYAVRGTRNFFAAPPEYNYSE